MILGVSTSVPGAQVNKIEEEPDTLGETFDEQGSRRVMTDGAAAVSENVLRALTSKLGYDRIPSAVQARVAGAKGVWFIDPKSNLLPETGEEHFSIRVRESQKKLNLDSSADPSQSILEVLKPSKVTIPSTLSKQILLVLTHNGVQVSVFENLLQQELDRIVQAFFGWTESDCTDSLLLAKRVDEFRRVVAGKAKVTMRASDQRVHNMASPEDDDPFKQTFSYEESGQYIARGHHVWTGKPIDKAWAAYDMLISGFHPAGSQLLREMLKDIAKSCMERMLTRFALRVPLSAEAICIPDPTDTLEEGEIQLRFAKPIVDEERLLQIDNVSEGDVLVTRHPCLLPTDIQRVRAVIRPELSMYRDVIVFSIKGKRPLADLLAGGDYDGDTIRVIWEPTIVQPFKNSSERFADCPFDVDDFFDRTTETVRSFVAEHADKPAKQRDDALIAELMRPIFTADLRGQYGKMQLAAAYKEGCDSDAAIELAHKFNLCMDGPKTGLSIRDDVRAADMRKWRLKLPEWDRKDDGLIFARESNPFMFDSNDLVPVRRDGSLPDSVLDILQKRLISGERKLDRKVHDKLAGSQSKEDTDLSGYWRSAVRLQSLPAEHIVAIESHVKTFIECCKLTSQVIMARLKQKDKDRISGKTWSVPRSPVKRTQSESSIKLGGTKSSKTVAPLDASLTLSQSMGLSASIDSLDIAHGSSFTPATSLSASSSFDSRNGGKRSGTPPVVDQDQPQAPTSPREFSSQDEAARFFCIWPKTMQDHISKLHEGQRDWYELLRASCLYVHGYRYNSKFVFDLAWRWLIKLKAQATRDSTVLDDGKTSSCNSVVLPMAVAERMRLPKRVTVAADAVKGSSSS